MGEVTEENKPASDLPAAGESLMDEAPPGGPTPDKATSDEARVDEPGTAEPLGPEDLLEDDDDRDLFDLGKHLSSLFPPPSTVPVLENWEVSLAVLASKLPRIPKIAVKALGLFDRFGAVHIGPEKVGFDGDEVDWSKVTEIRTRRLSDVITGRGVDREIDRIRGYLPPIPGRKWAVTKAVEVLLMLCMVALEDQLTGVAQAMDGTNKLVDGADEGERAPADDRVVSEIVYKGLVFKGKELQGGLLAAAVLGQVRGADHAIREMARQKGIPVVAAEDGNRLDDASERAAAIRERLAELRERFTKRKKEKSE